jgi:hypothetical protein
VNADPARKTGRHPRGPSLGREAVSGAGNRSRLGKKTINSRGWDTKKSDEQGFAPCSFFCAIIARILRCLYFGRQYF